ncbi:MAG TPA: SRPBCC domain-containing protein [Anaerolineae bacterium]|nr:SRPBCC domain-containing protein [Anaerolineae bacterium]
MSTEPEKHNVVVTRVFDAPVEQVWKAWVEPEMVKHLQRIEYILKFTDKDGEAFDPAEMGLPQGIPREVRNVNTFKDLGNGKTEMTITEYSYTSAQAHDLSHAGLEQCLDKLAAIFAKA